MSSDAKDAARSRGAFWLVCGVRVIAGLVVIFAYVGGDHHRTAEACTPSAGTTPKYSFERDTPEDSARAIRQPKICGTRAAASVVWR